MIVMAVGIVGCTSSVDPEPTSETTGGAEVVPATPLETAQDEPAQPESEGLPEGYELASVGATGQAVPSDSTALRTVVVVGAGSADPRFIEYTLFDSSDEASADATAELVGLNEASAVVEFSTGAFVFLSPGAPPRPSLKLLSHGPPVNATFRAVVEEGILAVGGSASLQPTDIEALVGALSAGEVPDAQVLPQRMSVLVDDVLPEGRAVELTSVHGTTSVVVYEGVGREWFDYFTWTDPGTPPPTELADLAGDVSLQPPTNYGANGTSTDPVRLSLWADDRLTIIEQPHTVPPVDARAVATLMVNESAFNELMAETTGLKPDSEPEPATADLERPASEAPSPQDLAGFQRYVESRIGRELGQPIEFDYVANFPTEGIDFDFISHELWLVAAALGLTGDDHTFKEANQSRIDAIRGTPGVIALQPTRTETDVVTVHEMVHLLNPDAVNARTAEPFSMGQVVSEGNAHRIAYDYLLTLAPEEQLIMEPFPHIFPKDGDPRIAPAVQDLLEFAYDEGRVFMAAAAEHGGEDRVAEVFRRPPTSTEQIVFFDAWLRDDQPTGVPVPASPAGTTKLSEGSLGVYLLLLVATEGDGADAALVSLQQWSGDSYVLYEAGPEICLATSIDFDSSQAASDLSAILETAAESVETDSQTVQATFCA